MQPLFANSERGFAHGAQFFLQRRTANGLAGWVSYSYTSSRLCDGVLNLCYAADYEQRHSVNVYGSYRLRPSVNLSAHWTYGSGVPLRGFFLETSPGQYLLAVNRNQVRAPDYKRLDLRINKTFARDRFHSTLFVEVINLLNARNYRIDDLDKFNATTGQANPVLAKTLPLVPSVGWMIEF
jgi:hypothetical protein